MSMPAQWDQAAALRRVDGDAELLAELLQVFFNDYPNQLERLLQAAACQDYASLRRTAHRLKGGLGYLAAGEAERMAREIEAVADDAEPSEVTALVFELAARVEALRELMPCPKGEACDGSRGD